MSNAQRYKTREEERHGSRRPLEVVWNILGFGFALVMGAAGYLGAEWFLLENEANRWVFLPTELAWPPSMPFLAFKVVIGLVGMTLGGIIFTLIYGVVAPVKGGRYDVETGASGGREYRS